MSSYFAWAVRERLIAVNPVTPTRLPKSHAPRTEMYPFGEDELERLWERASAKNRRLAEIGQRLERPDRPKPPLDAKELEQPREERELVDIQTEAGVPELLENEEKKAAAATEIENRFRRTAV